MGQVYVASVRVDQLPEVVAALEQAGFDIGRVEFADQEEYRCRRGGREIILGVSPGRPDLDEAFVVFPHPPYTVWPWKWGGDSRFFGDITTVLDGFHYCD